MTDFNTPSEAIIIGDDGLPQAHIDIDRLQTDATLLMYALCATAGDDGATTTVAAECAAKFDPDYFGYLCAAALTLSVRHVLAPTLDAAARLGVDLRPGLRSARDAAQRDLGGQ